jgi:GT2 family glycosyltransferase
MKTISVVIPTYHRYEALQDTVRDLLQQTVAPKQIIVVDNTTLSERKRPDYLVSNDKTECIYISSVKEGRINAARNEGLRQVTADYVILFDDDMSLPADCLENFLKVHAEGWDSVTGTLVEEGEILESRNLGAARPIWRILRTQHGTRPGTTIAVPSGFVSVRTEVIREIGYLDENFVYNYDDYDLGIRIWKSGYTSIRDPRVQGNHLKLPSGGSRTALTESARRLNKYKSKYYFVLKHFNKRAVKIEFITDILFIILDRKFTPLRAARELFSVVRAFMQYSSSSEIGTTLRAASPAKSKIVDRKREIPTLSETNQ